LGFVELSVANRVALLYCFGYGTKSMNKLESTPEFDAWLAALKDGIGRVRILARLKAAAYGNFGDCAPVGDAVFEMRIHVGPGYRIYYVRKGSLVYLLLAGGTKGTQTADISKAKRLADEF